MPPDMCRPISGVSVRNHGIRRASGTASFYYLDRYCYRCHSSIKYHVFERQEVKRKGDIEARLTELQDATLWMPQDRMFPGLAQIGVATPDRRPQAVPRSPGATATTAIVPIRRSRQHDPTT